MPDTPPNTANTNRPTLTLDVARYQHMLDMPDAGEAEKKEMIEALWLLVLSFIDAGFDVRPTENCGEDTQIDATASQPHDGVIDSGYSPTSAVFAAAANEPATKQEAS